ncbi:Ferric reductase transmembrane component 1 [Sphaceloma murrayae]|uniref:Ferric reductase transmembrane component 1 n=1 Tax=Sphaceloma murrayae TaxID=2082308 RepID=A0A2K1QWA1_9PEZI|nr:Ferric reductase transmembrane component 1 [Sphaceloma murrayae]
MPGMVDMTTASRREVLRLALQASRAAAEHGSLYTFREGEGDSEGSSILGGVMFSRRLVLLYNLILLLVLTAFTAWHWSHRLSEIGQISAHNGSATSQSMINPSGHGHERGSHQHGSSLTPNRNSNAPTSLFAMGNATQDAPSADERKPLLGHYQEKSEEESSFLKRIHWTVRSWLMYQPRPIPILNKLLPDNLTSLIVLLFIAYNAFFLCYNIHPVQWSHYIFADRAGLLFVANLPLLYLFSTKNCPLQPMTGFSYENLNILHRRLGEMMCFLALLHTSAFVLVWYEVLYPTGFTFWQLLALTKIWLGFSAFACYELLYLSSLGSFRQVCYELFLASHIFLQIGGLGFLFFHYHTTRPYVGTALVIFIIDRILYRMLLARNKVKADLTVLPDGTTVLLSANWAISSQQPSFLRRVVGQNMQSGWSPADHVFISIPSMPIMSAIQAHPFTIASAAPGPAHTHAWLDLVIRARDGFSKTLLHHAEKQPRIDVAIDGPYGSHHALQMARTSDTVVLVAGGSGIAVTLPLAWDLVTTNKQRKRQRVVLVWIVHDARHIEWVGHERLDELRELGLLVVIPEPTNKAGRPDVVRLMKDAIGENGWDKRIGTVVSGPDSMNREVNNICASMVKRGMDVSVAVEKFGW